VEKKREKGQFAKKLVQNDGFDSYITSSHQSHPYMTNGIGVSSASVLYFYHKGDDRFVEKKM
jgi:hypothetical protein